MLIMRFFSVFIFFLWLITVANAQTINIAVFYESSIKSAILTPVTGQYQLICDTTVILSLNQNEVVSLSIVGDSINVKSIDKQLGKYHALKLKAINVFCSVKLKPIQPDIKQRIYDGDFKIKPLYGRLLFINKVHIDSYLAGVVEAEGGYKAFSEYYKSQAVLCRTYVYENILKHQTEDFNLCDGVHCQAYKGKCQKNEVIKEATFQTSGKVIVDSNGNLITAAFHSNCGGETSNSQDVWVMPKSYLTSVNDPYCKAQLNSLWSKSIPVADWKNYLERKGIKVKPADFAFDGVFFDQPKRKRSFSWNGDSIPLKNMRTDLHLKSTFFSLELKEGQVLFKGRGYGHGVGLCQEGAMKMASKGFNYQDIIKHYYQNVFIKDISELNILKYD